MTKHTALLGLWLGAVGGVGCVADGAAPGGDEVATTDQSIQGGQLETGYPSVGQVLLGNGGFCSGTVIAPSYVLTAAHCAGAGMTFNTGTDASNFIGHPVDQQITHPTLDLLIAHLATPIAGVPLLPWNLGAPPALGSVCTAVGFGWYDINGVTTMGTKRSATEQVTSSSASQVVVQMVTGIADHGDSGGPLLCNSAITAVVHNHTDGVWPQHTVENCTTIDSAWIASVISPAWIDLALQNGWTNAPFATRNAQVALVGGIVRLRGAIGNGSGVAFTLPVGMRPATMAYVPVNLCNATKGRLNIQPDGVVSVQAEDGAVSNAQCFTSLEGAQFAPSASGFTGLALQNGWTNAPFATSNAAAANIAGIVQLKGAIGNGTSAVAFTLPVGMRPATAVYVPIDLCSATKGRLNIQATGQVSIEQAGGGLTNAQCFTSLDGASFATTAIGFTGLAMQNGWTNAPFGTSNAAAANIGAIVQLKGAIANGSTAGVFTLPVGLRPATQVYVPVDLCGAAMGRLWIQPSGVATVQIEGGTLATAQCFTSLDGATFSL
jgi:hypothetical protein